MVIRTNNIKKADKNVFRHREMFCELKDKNLIFCLVAEQLRKSKKELIFLGSLWSLLLKRAFLRHHFLWSL